MALVGLVFAGGFGQMFDSNNITLSSALYEGAASFTYGFPGCGASAAGITSASADFSCSIDVAPLIGGPALTAQFSGSASAETGLGPYGIGANMFESGNGNYCGILGMSPGNLCVWSFVSLFWSQGIAVEGGQGTALMDVSVQGATENFDNQNNNLIFTLWEGTVPHDFSSGDSDPHGLSKYL
jgi:hypothetical protein